MKGKSETEVNRENTRLKNESFPQISEQIYIIIIIIIKTRQHAVILKLY